MKIALGLEYNGNNYYGWQSQIHLPTIQSCLEHAISIVANENINVFCAGRTDTKVHATGQVVHFETKKYIKNINWIMGINSNLPKDISVHWISNVKDNFHARFSAVARNYRYIIYNDKIRSSILYNGIKHYYINKLNSKLMERAGKYIIGEHDFTSFRSINCQSYTPWRNIHYIYVKRIGKYIIFDIKANSFLYHMVRNIIGILIEIGSGKKPEIWIKKILYLRNNKFSNYIVSADGLYLTKIFYPKYFFI